MSRLLVIALLLIAPVAAGATSISYEVLSLGATRHRVEYAVTHQGPSGAAPLVWFQIDFDPGLYDEATLQIVSPGGLAVDFDQLLLGSGIALPAAYDVLALAVGIAPGETRAGFAVEFDWLGAGIPGAQTFRVLDPGTRAAIETGRTASIPEPGRLAFVAVLLLAMAPWLRRGAAGAARSGCSRTWYAVPLRAVRPARRRIPPG